MTYPKPATVRLYGRDGDTVTSEHHDHVDPQTDYVRIQPVVLDHDDVIEGESRVPETRYVPWHRVHEIVRTGKGHE